MSSSATDAPAPADRALLDLEVVRTSWPTASTVRVVLGGPQAHRFDGGEHTDRYVKLLFPRPGATLPAGLGYRELRETVPPDRQPTVRTYTVRWHDPEAHELAIDFVTHGDRGVAAPWAAAATPGDRVLVVARAGGGYRPDPAADGHLFVGDEAAFPAIASALEVLPAGARALALLESDGPDHRPALETAADLEVVWVDRGGEVPGDALVRAVRDHPLLDGDVHAFVHGELAAMRALRPHLTGDRAIARDRLSLSGYWRHGTDEDGFQAEKRAIAAAEAATA